MERLDDADNDASSITIISNKFSDFTIVYTDKAKEVESSNHKTGDSISNWIGLIIVSMILKVGALIYKK